MSGRKLPGKSRLHAVVVAAAEQHGVTAANIYGWSKQREIVAARETAIKRMSADFGMSNSAIAAFFGMHATSVWAVFNREKKRKQSAIAYHARRAMEARA